MIVVVAGVFAFLIYASLVGLATCFTKPNESGILPEVDYHLFKNRFQSKNDRYFR